MPWSKAPLPPTPLWWRPSTWAVVALALGCALLFRSLLRKLRRRQQAGKHGSFADFHSQLEKSAKLSLEEVATLPPPPPTTATPMTAPLSTSSSSQQPPAPAAAAAAPEYKRGFSWLRGAQAAKVPPLAELLRGDGDPAGSSEPRTSFLRAVASELCVDAPDKDSPFDGVPGLTVVPAYIPKGTRAALLHAAVKSEAEKLKPVERAEAVVHVGKSMVVDLVNRAAELKDAKSRIAALDNLVLFVSGAEQICAELAPDVEPGKVTYEGGLKYKRLEELYEDYLDTSAQEAQQQTNLMLASLMGGQDVGDFGGAGNMAQMEANAEVVEKHREILAAIFKIPESKAEKMMQKKMEVVAQEAQKELWKGLQNMA